MQLAGPPIIEHLLLENPWPIGLACAAVALALLWFGAQRMQKNLKFAGFILLMISASVFIAASAITTTRELLTANTHQLMHSTAPLDISTFRSHVHPNAVLQGPDGAPWVRAEKIFEGLQQAVRRFPFESQTVLDVQSESGVEGPARTLVDVRTNTETHAVVTRWLLTWRREGDNPWQIVSVQWLDSPHTLGFKPQRAWVPVP